MKLVQRSSMILVLLVACGGPAHKGGGSAPLGNSTVPTGGGGGGSGSLAEATRIEIRDTWVGLGCTHEFTATLTASGSTYSGPASLATGYGEDAPEQKTVSLPATSVAMLQAAVDEAKAAMATAQAADATSVSSWTDDYPSGSMTFSGPHGDYVLSFTDQHRKLELSHGADVVPLDREQDIESEPSKIWQAYSAVLDAAGMSAWISARCDRQ